MKKRDSVRVRNRPFLDRGRLALAVLGVVFGIASPAVLAANGPTDRPHILFLAVDDLNDWVGPLGGHPLAHTPNLDRLAARGTTFLNAHCQASLCNPSRVSVLTGKRPTTTGIYGLEPAFRAVETLRDEPTLIQRFASHGYVTWMAGKVSHHHFKASPAFEAEVGERGPRGGPGDIFPPQKHAGETPMGNNSWMDWGAHPHDEARKGDTRVTDWAVEKIAAHAGAEPVFLAVGFFLPHVPCYVTPERLARVPTVGVRPPLLPNDRADVPDFAWYLHWSLPEPRLEWMEAHHQLVPYIRAYLACVTYMDEQVGRLLDALEDHGWADNTIVVLWGDNGMHFGEKGITGKNSLWEPGTRVPLIFAGPGVSAGGRVTVPVELLDMYPTLLDLAGLPPVDDLEGLSLVPQLREATARRERPALTTANPGNHAVRSERYRYIHYADGSEEFYDHLQDPEEWRNLARDPAYAGLLEAHRQWLPGEEAPPVPGSDGRTLLYDQATGAVWWEGDRVEAGALPPH